MRIVSGGQSGVDRAALDAAIAQGRPVGGWCPKGRWAEDGPIPERYPLVETPSRRPEQRTRWNVRDSEALLVIVGDEPSRGTRLAESMARRLDRPVLSVHVDDRTAAARIVGWLSDVRPASLNVAGPRESESPGIYRRTLSLLEAAMKEALRASDPTDA